MIVIIYLEHWLEKQNRYTTAEAEIAYRGLEMAVTPALFGSTLQRRVWLKKYVHLLPFRYAIFLLYNLFVVGAWKAGWIGLTWARPRSDVMKFIALKRREMEITGKLPAKRTYGTGPPDDRVEQFH